MAHTRILTTLVVISVILGTICGCGGGGSKDARTIPVDPGGDKPNQPPSITSVAPTSTASEPIKLSTEEQLVLHVSASDPDNDPLVYQWSTSVGTITGSGSQEVTYTAPKVAAVSEVAVTVSDGKGHTASARFYISIAGSVDPLPVNNPPTVTLAANPQTVDASGTANLTATASDPDGDSLTYSWNCYGGTLESVNGSIAGWIAPSTPGSYTVTVSVSDNKAPAVLASVSITVGNGTVNPPIVNGLTGRYYKNDGSLAHPIIKEADFKFETVDPAVNFVWDKGTPHPDLNDPTDGKPRDFAVRWTGFIKCEQPGTYTFKLRYDDGARLVIGDDAGQSVTVIDGWATGPTGSQPRMGQITLQGGKWYPVMIDYYEDESSAYVQLFWSPPGATSDVIIPTDVLRTE